MTLFRNADNSCRLHRRTENGNPKVLEVREVLNVDSEFFALLGDSGRTFVPRFLIHNIRKCYLKDIFPSLSAQPSRRMGDKRPGVLHPLFCFAMIQDCLDKCFCIRSDTLCLLPRFSCFGLCDFARICLPEQLKLFHASPHKSFCRTSRLRSAG